MSELDAIVRMDRCGICGSDLHIYQGHGFTEDLGYCVGHEAVGEVVEVGRGVRRLKAGDKVMLSAAVGCGSCANCLAGEINRCITGRAGCYGLSHNLEGCQAEAIRVPAADFNAAPIPEGLTADQALMLTDNLPTAWFGLRNAEVGPGDTVAVVGLGPIGLRHRPGAGATRAGGGHGGHCAGRRRGGGDQGHDLGPHGRLRG
jgi:threonine dehydrogenase-like Zn-dependent dehydrogenase